MPNKPFLRTCARNAPSMYTCIRTDTRKQASSLSNPLVMQNRGEPVKLSSLKDWRFVP